MLVPTITGHGHRPTTQLDEYIRAFSDHCGDVLFSTALVNMHKPSGVLLRKYEETGSHAVEIDRIEVMAFGVKLIERDLLSEDETIRHDPDRLAHAVLELCEG